VLRDLRHAGRLLRRAPAFAATAILTLTLGIGMTTAIFSVVNAVLLRPVPYPDAERLVMVWETDRDTGTTHEPGSWPDYVDFEERSRTIDRFAGLIADEATFTPDRGEPSRVAEMRVTHGLLPLLGLTPVLGRPFTAEDDRMGGPAIALISERLWDRAFQRDPAVVGRTIRLDDRQRTVIGVMPEGADFGILQVLSAADYGRGFADRDARSEVDVWTPLQANPEQLVRDTHPLLMLGRLAPGATVATAQDELASIAADLERAYQSNKARGVALEPLRTVIFGPTEPALTVLLAAVGLVLVISCVNVANLLLAQSAGRRREVAVRTAVGASGSHLVRQFVAENLVLTSVSSALGVVVAFVALRSVVSLAPPEVPRLASVAIDARVLSLALGISIVVAFVFGLLPVAQARRTDLQATLNAEDARGVAGSREGHAMRAALVVAELAFAVALVTGAGLLIKSFWQLRQVDPGFDPAGVLKAEFQLPDSRYPFDFKRWPNLPEIQRFNAELIARTAALPGVNASAIAANHPLDAGFTNSFVIVGREAESRDLPEISVRTVTPGYFRALRVPLVTGRLLDDRDSASTAPVVVINEAAAVRLFPGQSPVGQRLAYWGTARTIVGVIGNERIHGLAKAAPIAAYTPLAQAPARGGQALLLSTAGDPNALARPVREAIAAIDPGLAVFGVESLDRTLAESIGTERFLMILLALFAGLALLLAAIGIHGVLSYSVAQRSREIGIRMALGAPPRSVTRLVIGQAARLTACGLGLGLLFGLFFARSLRGLLFGVTSTDVVTLAGVLLVLTAVAALSTWLPVRRAVSVDPLVALRQE
jgi:predicted permease